MATFSVCSLFSGCGGLDLGFSSEGFDLLYACDNDPAAVRCYARNLDPRVYVRDVAGLEFHRDIEEVGSCDVVLGGFPCQGFSKAGPKVADDPRNTLYMQMKRAVERLRPAIFVAENVDGMSQNFGGEFVDRITRDFRAIGYQVESRILQAADYGVPQYRRRIFFAGVRKNLSSAFRWPKPTHASGNRNGEFLVDDVDLPLFDGARIQKGKPLDPLTMAQAISDLVELNDLIPDHKIIDKWPEEYRHIFKAIKPGQKLCNVRHAATSVYTWQIPEVFGLVPDRERLILETISKNRRHRKYGSIPNGNPIAPEVIEALSGLQDIALDIRNLLNKGYLKEKNGKYDLQGAMFCSGLFKRPLWHEPSPTILTVFDNPRYFLHPLRDRPFSVRECARLQGFPDRFVFCEGSGRTELKDAYRLIGNAVPPPLASAIARSVKQMLMNIANPHGNMERQKDEITQTQSAA